MLAPSVCSIASSSGGTMGDRLEDFQKFRTDLNEEILGCGHLGINRFFALDHQACEPGPLGTKNKELLGWKREELIDALNVALIVGGSTTIPHVRRAFARLCEIGGL